MVLKFSLKTKKSLKSLTLTVLRIKGIFFKLRHKPQVNMSKYYLENISCFRILRSILVRGIKVCHLELEHRFVRTRT